MAGLDPRAAIPTEIKLHQSSRLLELTFADGSSYRLPYEFLRVYSPSADVRGHGPGQETLQVGKREVTITDVEAVGHYAIRPKFSDGHDTGIYSWDYLHELGERQEPMWQQYLERMRAAGASREPDANRRRRRRQRTPAVTDTEAMSEQTDFGYEQVAPEEKTRRVRGVFDSVATRYDLMNDLMSLGMHRAWKRFTIAASGVRPGARVLDVAGGTADLARLFAARVGPTGSVVLTDINGAMLAAGRDRMLNEGRLMPAVQCNAEALPFPAASFDCVSIAFGLRNVTRKEMALAEMRRVLRPGGVALILEFSRVWAPLKPAYDWYSFNVLPRLGQVVANDAASYRYLAESIRVHPDQQELGAMMESAGLERVEWFNLSAGVVALHRGYVF